MVAKNNSGLLANLGNFVNCALTFQAKQYAPQHHRLSLRLCTFPTTACVYPELCAKGHVLSCAIQSW